nr:MAG TPA: hypothetical protein [Caudoviricetes sp.]
MQSRVNPFCHRVSADFSPRKREWLRRLWIEIIM